MKSIFQRKNIIEHDGKPYEIQCSKKTSGCTCGGRRVVNKYKCMLPKTCRYVTLTAKLEGREIAAHS